MKGYFANHPVRTQLTILFFIEILGLLLGTILISLVSFIFNYLESSTFLGIDQSILLIQISLLISSICTFLFPALYTAWLCSKEPVKFLNIQSFPNPKLLFWVILSFFLLSPLISLSGYLNNQMELPEILNSVESWMKQMEYAASSTTEKILSNNNNFSFIINILVVGIAAGVSEEFLFRGTLLGILKQKIKNYHFLIWTIAIFFSLIHFQFYGFIPRMLLGAYLGYLLIWTKNIWIPVFVHFLNNTIAILVLSNQTLKKSQAFSENIPQEDLIWYIITAGVCFIFFIGCSICIQKEGSKKVYN